MTGGFRTRYLALVSALAPLFRLTCFAAQSGRSCGLNPFLHGGPQTRTEIDDKQHDDDVAEQERQAALGQQLLNGRENEANPKE
jgi:hypothetical protein